MRLGERDALKRADDIVGAFGGEETFVVTGAEIPVRSFVIFVPIKSPHPTYHDDAAHPVVPVIADVVKTEISPGVGAFETGVIVQHELRNQTIFLARARAGFPA